MLCTCTRFSLTRSQHIFPTIKRTYKKDPSSFGKIRDAQKKLDEQQRKTIDNYYQKYKNELKNLERMKERESQAEKSRKRIKKVEKVYRMPKTEEEFIRFAKQTMEAHYDRYKMDAMLDFESVNFMWFLHKDDPYYWNPIRLGNLFDCDAVTVRGILWERKLAQEAEKAGDMLHSSQTFDIPWKYLSKKEIKLASRNQLRWEFDEVLGRASVPNKNCYPHQTFQEPLPDQEKKGGRGGRGGRGGDREDREEGRQGKIINDDDDDEPEYADIENEYEMEPMLPLLRDRDWTREYGIKDAEEKIRYAYGRIFGLKSIGKDFRMWPPRERPVGSKKHIWHFLPAGTKSKEVLNCIRSYYSKHTVESPRIPPRQLDPPVPIKKYFVTGEQIKGTMPGKKIKTTLVDLSSCYNMYNRVMHVRDENNNWRTPTWDERRKFHDQRRYIKRPPRAEDMIIYPDEDQPDHMAVSHKPPKWILENPDETNEVYYGDFENINFEKEKSGLSEKELERIREEEAKRKFARGGKVTVVNKKMRLIFRYLYMVQKNKEDMLERNRYEHGLTLNDPVLGVREDNPWFNRWWNHIDTDY